jgi:hypothetical protein
MWAALNTLAVQSAPANRGGAISVIGAFKFGGGAIAPLIWLPLYVVEPELAFAVAGVAGAAIALVALMLRGVPSAAPADPAERVRAAAAPQP